MPIGIGGAHLIRLEEMYFRPSSSLSTIYSHPRNTFQCYPTSPPRAAAWWQNNRLATGSLFMSFTQIRIQTISNELNTICRSYSRSIHVIQGDWIYSIIFYYF